MKTLTILLAIAAILGLSLSTWLNAQTVDTVPVVAAACTYNTSPPSVTSGQFVLLQCNSSGQLVIAP